MSTLRCCYPHCGLVLPVEATSQLSRLMHSVITEDPQHPGQSVTLHFCLAQDEALIRLADLELSNDERVTIEDWLATTSRFESCYDRWCRLADKWLTAYQRHKPLDSTEVSLLKAHKVAGLRRGRSPKLVEVMAVYGEPFHMEGRTALHRVLAW